MRKISIALGFKGKFYSKILKAWDILDKKLKIKHIKNNTSEPHINIISGTIQKNKIDKLYLKIKSIKAQKFKIKSPGLGIFANKKISLFIRWERNKKILNLSKSINKKTTSIFNKVDLYATPILWEPRSALAYIDLKFDDLKNINKKIKFMFQKHETIIDSIYLIDYTKKEVITHKINLKNY